MWRMYNKSQQRTVHGPSLARVLRAGEISAVSALNRPRAAAELKR